MNPKSPLPDLKKLGVEPGQNILLRRAAPEVVEALKQQVPENTRVTTRQGHGTRYDLILYYPAPDEDFEALFERMQDALTPAGALWVIIPHARVARARGVRYSWNGMINAALKTKLVDNKTLSFTPEEYGTRFVIRKAQRPVE